MGGTSKPKSAESLKHRNRIKITNCNRDRVKALTNLQLDFNLSDKFCMMHVHLAHLSGAGHIDIYLHILLLIIIYINIYLY